MAFKKEMIKNKVISIILGILLLKNTIVFTRTRDDVISEANNYKNYKWTPQAKNLLDVVKFEYNEETKKWEQKSGSDEIDDRAQISPDGKTYYPEGKTSLWPFQKKCRSHR